MGSNTEKKPSTNLQNQYKKLYIYLLESAALIPSTAVLAPFSSAVVDFPLEASLGPSFTVVVEGNGSLLRTTLPD